MGRTPLREPSTKALSAKKVRTSVTATVLAWVFLVYMTVPWNIFDDQSSMASGYQVNPLARMLKLAMLALGFLLVIRQWAKFIQLLRHLNKGFLAFLIVVPLSYFWSISPADTLARYISIVTEVFVCSAICLVGWHRTRFQELLRPCVTVLLVGSIIFGLVSPDLAIEHGTGTLHNAWHGLTTQKNEFGQLASFGVILWLHGWLTREVSPWKAIVFGLLSMWCVLLSRSSTSLLATLFVICFLLLLLRSPPSLRRYMPYIITLYASVVLTYALAVLQLVPGLEVLLQPIAAITGKDMTFSNRAMIWQIVKEHIQLSPYIGSGYGAYWIGPVPMSPSYTFLSRMFFYPSESHNGYLEIVNDLGFMGLLILLSYLIIYVRQCLKLMKVDRFSGALFLGFFFQQAIMNLSESCWLTVNSAFLFAIMTFATLSIARHELDNSRVDMTRGTRR
ncbi:MAG: O-antigen ligase family protein [Steroidobacteraceae bacterium]